VKNTYPHHLQFVDYIYPHHPQFIHYTYPHHPQFLDYIYPHYPRSGCRLYIIFIRSWLRKIWCNSFGFSNKASLSPSRRRRFATKVHVQNLLEICSSFSTILRVLFFMSYQKSFLKRSSIRTFSPSFENIKNWQ
jgi:hypothetical protein